MGFVIRKLKEDEIRKYVLMVELIIKMGERY